MSDDLTHPGEPDPDKVNIGQQHEVDYWTKELGVTEEELRTAVSEVGVMIKDIRAHLKK